MFCSERLSNHKVPDTDVIVLLYNVFVQVKLSKVGLEVVKRFWLLKFVMAAVTVGIWAAAKTPLVIIEALAVTFCKTLPLVITCTPLISIAPAKRRLRHCLAVGLICPKS